MNELKIPALRDKSKITKKIVLFMLYAVKAARDIKLDYASYIFVMDTIAASASIFGGDRKLISNLLDNLIAGYNTFDIESINNLISICEMEI